MADASVSVQYPAAPFSNREKRIKILIIIDDGRRAAFQVPYPTAATCATQHNAMQGIIINNTHTQVV